MPLGGARNHTWTFVLASRVQVAIGSLIRPAFSNSEWQLVARSEHSRSRFRVCLFALGEGKLANGGEERSICRHRAD